MESTLIPIRPYVNGSYLIKYIGKPVNLIGTLVKVGDDSKSLTLQTTDDQVVTVNFQDPIDSSLDGWIQVQGFAKDKSTISAESYYNLPSSITEDFDKQEFNETVRLINTLSNSLK